MPRLCRRWGEDIWSAIDILEKGVTKRGITTLERYLAKLSKAETLDFEVTLTGKLHALASIRYAEASRSCLRGSIVCRASNIAPLAHQSLQQNQCVLRLGLRNHRKPTLSNTVENCSMDAGDAASGLYKLGARYYDPSTGRFTQYDPSGQESNPYAYAGCNPIAGSDPSGLATYGAAFGNAVVAGFFGAVIATPITLVCGGLATAITGATAGAGVVSYAVCGVIGFTIGTAITSQMTGPF